MKIQCDACEKATAAVICCADEAALCARCDVEVHAANKLASKHQRLSLLAGGGRPPPPPPTCDVCQEKPAFIFCVEDRALLCRDCDEPIHVAGTLSGRHQRFLATGIPVGLATDIPAVNPSFEPPPPPPTQLKMPSPPPPQWAGDVDELELFQLADYDSKQVSLDWLADIGGIFNDVSPAPARAAEVPVLRPLQQQPPAATAFSSAQFFRQSKPPPGPRFKKPRLDLAAADDDDDYLIVPNIG